MASLLAASGARIAAALWLPANRHRSGNAQLAPVASLACLMALHAGRRAGP